MKAGQSVRLRAFGGEIIERRVLRISGDTVVVCTDAEADAAADESRVPRAVGFPVSAVVSDEPSPDE